MRLLTALLALLMAPLALTAQERPNTILVLDGSGSMWGQIDGVNKIVIAREVVAEILANFPADQNLGLTTYGHRVRGDCTDIETLIAPAPGAAAAIIAAVNDINPRGMTPMTDAVIAAAQALRSTEQAATVILISDGIETCNPDPCAAARALEEAGVAFTAHVVGFDVGSDPEALAQMQCIAEETGGMFLTAADAAELSAAMTTMAAAVTEPEPVTIAEPAPAVHVVTFRAYLGDETNEISDRIVWDLRLEDTVFNSDARGDPLVVDLSNGAYSLTAYYTEDETAIDANFIVINADQTVSVTFPLPEVKATLIAQNTAPLGATIQVGWDGPGAQNDFVAVGQPGERYTNYAWTRNGNPVDLLMPNSTGNYELRYYDENDTIIGTREITVTEVAFGLTAPTEAAIGASVTVEWVGPGYRDDFISVGLPGERYTNYSWIRGGNPIQLQMPREAGEYEIRYSLGQGDLTMASQMITITELAVSISAPAGANAGESVTVDWVGPGYDDDFIAVGRPGERYTNYTWTREGNPTQLLMPSEPGEYEIRYVLGQGEATLAAVPVTVSKLEVTISGATEAPAGATIPVTFTGPAYDDDFIAVGRVGERYVNYTWVRSGNPAQLLLPAEPGEYEVRYVLGQDEVTQALYIINVTPLSAQLIAPASGVAGTKVIVGFDGPAYDDDYIGIGPVGDRYTEFTWTRDGNPVSLQLPDVAGEYEIRYYLGQGEVILATVPFTVTKP